MGRESVGGGRGGRGAPRPRDQAFREGRERRALTGEPGSRGGAVPWSEVWEERL